MDITGPSKFSIQSNKAYVQAETDSVPDGLACEELGA